ncbi:hypothetical protein COC42_14580 [Sphingomonas spermidinifaciens]|uniref:Uncharacterized protein n=1 Tax=Sphingomonas spermidinifaciens TaxID=1141889 RepID=A0A2A4B4A6_9SPHN|nr:hypothetical protein [Sphingomonas spermidinifaciens]PCD02619.1 hypothetical protein COC42_14580 [Sphingomonas spermidinifaciens]
MSRTALLAVLPLLAISGCVAPSRPLPSPPPAPRPTPAPVPVPAPPPPPPASSDWRDWPLTPGNWRYAAVPGGSVARFGAGVATLSCDRTSASVTLTFQGSGTRAVVRTSSTARTLALTPGTGGVSVRLPARDGLLDAMGFSRGRFVVEGVSPRPLVIPAWPEILRVAEDCR